SNSLCGHARLPTASRRQHFPIQLWQVLRGFSGIPETRILVDSREFCYSLTQSGFIYPGRKLGRSLLGHLVPATSPEPASHPFIPDGGSLSRESLRIRRNSLPVQEPIRPGSDRNQPIRNRENRLPPKHGRHWRGPRTES